MVQDANENQMTDSEIIDLMSEYNIKESEMSKILKELKSKDFEYVINYIENRQKGKEKSAKEANAKIMEEAKEINDQKQREAEIQERYKKQLLEKIKANRIEQQQKEAAELKSLPVSSHEIEEINAFIRVKAVIDDSREIVLGFEQNSTVNDIYSKLQEELGKSVVSIKKFGHGKSVSASSERIFDVFSSRAFMIDVEYK